MKDEILNRVRIQKWKQQEVVDWLADNHDIKINIRTLGRHLKDWDALQQDRTVETEDLRKRIHFLFCRWGLSDEEMLEDLQDEGFTITSRGLVRIRKELGFKRLELSPEARAHMDEVTRGLIEEELGKNVIQDLGRGYLVEHFRKLGHPVKRYSSYDPLYPQILKYLRDRLFAQYRTLVPDAVDRRLRDIQRQRGEYVVAGPNLVWSVDGHDKLSEFGIQIYGGIDAYARYVIWNNVSISNRTAVSVLRGFLDVVSELGQQSRFVRSDRGGETVLMAQAHLQLLQAYEADMSFDNCYWYGTSTANQRIESWWGQMTKSLTGKWIRFFRSLRQSGLFSKDKLADQVALLAIYFPIIRTEVTHFVDHWNTHALRKQANRTNSVQGKPVRLYRRPPPGVQNYGVSLHQPTLERLRQDVEDYSKQATSSYESIFSFLITEILQIPSSYEDGVHYLSENAMYLPCICHALISLLLMCVLRSR